MRHSLRIVTAMAAVSILAGLSHASSAQTAEGAADVAAKPAPAAVRPLAQSASDPALKWGPCPPGMPEGCGIVVLQGDPSKPNADIFLRVPGGSAIPPHAHSSAERMILISGELEVKYQGAPQAILKATDYAYGPANLPHRANCRSEAACVLFIAFEGPVDVKPFEGSLE
jgi:uncharacterized RmlC-like cupin family protein